MFKIIIFVVFIMFLVGVIVSAFKVKEVCSSNEKKGKKEFKSHYKNK